MAVGFLSTPASMTAEQYDRVIKQSAASGAGDPPGRRFHGCFGPAHHLPPFDVCDNAEEYRACGLMMMAILAKEQIETAPAAPLEIRGLIEDGAASALRNTIDELRKQAFFLRPVEKLREKMPRAKKRSSEEDQPRGSGTK